MRNAFISYSNRLERNSQPVGNKHNKLPMLLYALLEIGIKTIINNVLIGPYHVYCIRKPAVFTQASLIGYLFDNRLTGLHLSAFICSNNLCLTKSFNRTYERLILVIRFYPRICLHFDSFALHSARKRHYYLTSCLRIFPYLLGAGDILGSIKFRV